MRIIYIAVLCCLPILQSCNNNSPVAETGHTDTTNIPAPVSNPPASSKLNDAGTQSIMSVLDRYYDIKNALVATDAAKAGSSARELALLADSLRILVTSDTLNAHALKPYTDTIIAQSKVIGALKDETCEHQRLAFGPLSTAIYGLLKAADINNVKIYRDYCPMAFNDAGAYWLSKESDITNPYFGKKMLTCGEITDSF